MHTIEFRGNGYSAQVFRKISFGREHCRTVNPCGTVLLEHKLLDLLILIGSPGTDRNLYLLQCTAARLCTVQFKIGCCAMSKGKMWHM